jgi:hypothetical protein
MDGTSTCLVRAAADAPHCGAPAAWHVAWTLTGGAQTTFLCDPCMAEISAVHVWEDRHPLGAACTLPGMTWAVRERACILHLDTTTAQEATHG